MANIFDPHFDDIRDHPGFSCRRAYVGRQAGSQRLGASVWELPPGEATCPYHYHHVYEELLFVLSGRPSLRTPDGWRDLEVGETVAFPVGPRGAHRLQNRTSEYARVLVVSPSGLPDILVYPDSGKVGAYQCLGEDDDRMELFRRADAVGYFDGETAE